MDVALFSFVHKRHWHTHPCRNASQKRRHACASSAMPSLQASRRYLISIYRRSPTLPLPLLFAPPKDRSAACALYTKNTASSFA